jgi:hypothetical protein
MTRGHGNKILIKITGRPCLTQLPFMMHTQPTGDSGFKEMIIPISLRILPLTGATLRLFTTNFSPFLPIAVFH